MIDRFLVLVTALSPSRWVHQLLTPGLLLLADFSAHICFQPKCPSYKHTTHMYIPSRVGSPVGSKAAHGVSLDDDEIIDDDDDDAQERAPPY